jgi:hypothetical protein
MRTLASICLNEEQFIENWLRYHIHSFDRIVIAEGAAAGYPAHAVTPDGLSTDRTAELIRAFPDPQHKITLVQYGWCGMDDATDDRVPAKIELRNACARLAPSGFLFTLDVDEFLHPFYVDDLVRLMDAEPEATACAIPQLHLWQTPNRYITGGYADVPHFRLFRWHRGCRYVENHNWPSGSDGEPLIARQLRPPLHVVGGRLAAPAIIHYGFCESKAAMGEKNAYYLARGEGTSRPATSSFRRAALEGRLPEGCRLHPYRGFLPFQPSAPPPRTTRYQRGPAKVSST